MKACRIIVVVLGVTLLGMAHVVEAVGPEQKCEAGKNYAAGRYVACLGKAEKKLIYYDNAGRYGIATARCAASLGAGWEKLESRTAAAGMACPSTDDQAAVQGFLEACQQSVAEALGGGTLPGDVVTCNDALAACDADLAACNDDLSTCDGSLGTCNSDLVTCGSALSGCANSLATAEDGLSTCSTGIGCQLLCSSSNSLLVTAGYRHLSAVQSQNFSNPIAQTTAGTCHHI